MAFFIVEREMGLVGSKVVDVLACGNGQWGGLGNATYSNAQGEPMKVKTISGLVECAYHHIIMTRYYVFAPLITCVFSRREDSIPSTSSSLSHLRSSGSSHVCHTHRSRPLRIRPRPRHARHHPPLSPLTTKDFPSKCFLCFLAIRLLTICPPWPRCLRLGSKSTLPAWKWEEV